MQIENYQKEYNSKIPKLIATFDVVTEKLTIRGMKVIQGSEGKPWFLGLPSIRQGEQWRPCIEFNNKSHQTAFLQKARDAVEQYVGGVASSPPVEDDIPF